MSTSKSGNVPKQAPTSNARRPILLPSAAKPTALPSATCVTESNCFSSIFIKTNAQPTLKAREHQTLTAYRFFKLLKIKLRLATTNPSKPNYFNTLYFSIA